MKTTAQQLGIKDFPFTIDDKNGNLIYFEESNGCWTKWEYDSKGNQIYYETSDGDWEKHEYNSKGNQIYYENSDGFWRKREYDSNGNEIYYENSDGDILDSRPKQNCEGKVVEIDGKKYQLKEVK